MQPANDNSRLASAESIAAHLTKGLPRMLEASGVSPTVRESVREFVAPAVALLNQTGPNIVAGLEGFAEEFSRAAATPEQARVAADFQEFVGWVATGRRPEYLPFAEECDQPQRGGPEMER